MPISKSNAVMVGIAAKDDDESEQKEAKDQEDLEDLGVGFDLSEVLDGEAVESKYQDQGDSDP